MAKPNAQDNITHGYLEDTPNPGQKTARTRDTQLNDSLTLTTSVLHMKSILQGSIPEVSYNEIRRTIVSPTSALYTFYYLAVKQFSIGVTDPATDTIVIINETNKVTLESGYFNILLESGDALLKEDS